MSAVEKHYDWQRERYGEAFKKMGLGVYTGKGGFYHWLELPEGLNSKEFNKRLFKRGAAILCASECDMARPHDKELLKDYQHLTIVFSVFHLAHYCQKRLNLMLPL